MKIKKCITILFGLALLDTSGEIVFQLGHENFAWGQNVSGFYIKEDGSVFSYRSGRTDPRWYQLETETVGNGTFASKEAVEQRYQNQVYLGKIENQEIDEMKELIAPASLGTITWTTMGADMGSSLGWAFLYDGDTERYQVINLGTPQGFLSDAFGTNSSEEANILLIWLAAIAKYAERQERFRAGIGGVFIADDVPIRNEEWWSANFNYFNSKYFPWIYHYQLGWMYWWALDKDVFLYDLERGWLWTSPTVLPHLYSFNSDNWIKIPQ